MSAPIILNKMCEQTTGSQESNCQKINCYLCEKRGIINPLVVKQQYSLLLKYISSDRKIRPICDLHNINPPPLKAKPCNTYEPLYYFHPENPRYFCDQMTPSEKFAESHTEAEIEHKQQILQNIQKLEDEYFDYNQDDDDENLQPQYYHLMNRQQLLQQARILNFMEEKQEITQASANKAVISKWMSRPPQPRYTGKLINTKVVPEIVHEIVPEIVHEIVQSTCCEPIRESVIPSDETITGYAAINHYLDILTQRGL